MEIKVDLTNIDKAISDLEGYKKTFSENVTQFVKEVTEVGTDKAQQSFRIAQYDGVNDVTVYKQVYKKAGVITARGEALLFIEFGTGLEAQNPRDIPMDLYTYAYMPGSWSIGPEGKGHWDNPNGWYYSHGNRSFGNPANKCMYNAAKEMERMAPKIAREVFK